MAPRTKRRPASHKLLLLNEFVINIGRRRNEKKTIKTDVVFILGLPKNSCHPYFKKITNGCAAQMDLMSSGGVVDAVLSE